MSPVYQPSPVIGDVFKKKVWNNMEPKELEDNLMQAVIEDPATNVTNVAVNYHPEKGDAFAYLELIGKVKTDLERKRIEDIIRVNTKDEIPVTNNISLQ